MRGLNRRLERLARAAQARQDHAGDDVVGLETWALLFAAARDSDEPGPDDWAAAEAFAAACVRMGERPTWAAQARQDHAGEDVVGLEGWALLFAAMFAADEEPDAEAMAAGEAFAEAFVTHCRARGVRVSIGSFGRQFKDRLPGAWGEIMRLAAEADEEEGR